MDKYRIGNGAGNPFSDSQARNYSDERVVSEFCAVSQFWTLFNDQHEIVIGPRGCGKTILLKMMRYSLLRELKQKRAQEIVNAKNYLCFYVPLHLEFIKRISDTTLDEQERITWFRFSFNCLLALSMIIEFKALLEDTFADDVEQYRNETKLTKKINEIWNLQEASTIHTFTELTNEIYRTYYNADPSNIAAGSLPKSFTHTIGSCLTSIRSCLCETFNISPTWIICIDEAEFLDDCYQKCINTAFRSDTARIAIKMATLPYYHRTKKTLDETIEVMDGQDFKYTFIHLQSDNKDYKAITNAIVHNRLAKENIHIKELEQFVATLPFDRYQDYYRKEIGLINDESDTIKMKILDQLPQKTREKNQGKKNEEIKKPLIDKYSPILYVREIYKKKRGQHIPVWYAGANMIRRISQGNPRIFIRIMDVLFECNKGKTLPVSLKQQHKAIEAFAKSFCQETEALEGVGPEAAYNLDKIARILHKKTHDKELSLVGLSFSLDENSLTQNSSRWLMRSVAFSRLFVDEHSITAGITKESVFELSNIYAVHYWLPMRAKPVMNICLEEALKEEYIVKTRNSTKKSVIVPGQISMNL